MAADARAGGRAIRREAPAKVNLYLHLLNRRPDGYHDLDSLIVFADVFDQIEAVPSNRLGLKLQGPFAPALETTDWAANLVVLAARALADTMAEKRGAAITLDKNLPVAAGIGGGSSDAAATIWALCKLWDLDIPDVELHAVARKLGADVPACLHRRPVFVGGMGDVVETAGPLPPVWLVLVNPGVPLVTVEVFQNFDRPGSGVARFNEAPGDVYALATILASRSNDLENVAAEMLPEIAEVISALEETEGCLLSRMSGSGATCFGMFADEAAARSAENALSDAHVSWWVKAGRILESDRDGTHERQRPIRT